ncbi:hypothetical protein BDV41DRAFT_572712 [Aspergillus transmontanensis]|uniref:Uncharacterized protein n=1 Tax=Aspergillus transmontanensis TaxID=1034304 RepID=A0A5N6WBP1_9EURO|nr:hypothetical protein BDV41DRAFT_572712 [Aspergillus transmontanensis]
MAVPLILISRLRLNNYLAQVGLFKEFAVDNGAIYQLVLTVSKIKHQTLWHNDENSALYCYGEHTLDRVPIKENELAAPRNKRGTCSAYLWRCDPLVTIPPSDIDVRISVAYAKAPNIQNAYWNGGFRSNQTERL